MCGLADPNTGRPVASGTPFYSSSIYKAAASTVAHLLVERGLLAYDTRLAEVWPEFGAHGKHKVTLRHALNHSAGVPGIPLTTFSAATRIIQLVAEELAETSRV